MININAFAGHLRIRTPMLREEHVLREITAIVRMVPGVTFIKAKVRTGSLLVKYDPAILPMHLRPTIEAMLPELKDLYKKYSDKNYEVYEPYVNKIKTLVEKNAINN